MFLSIQPLMGLGVWGVRLPRFRSRCSLHPGLLCSEPAGLMEFFCFEFRRLEAGVTFAGLFALAFLVRAGRSGFQGTFTAKQRLTVPPILSPSAIIVRSPSGLWNFSVLKDSRLRGNDNRVATAPRFCATETVAFPGYSKRMSERMNWRLV